MDRTGTSPRNYRQQKTYPVMSKEDTKKVVPDVCSLIEHLLSEGIEKGASDIHFDPTAGGLTVKFRLDGSLHIVEHLPGAIQEYVITRLKVLGGLLTYRNDIPQEGHIDWPSGQGAAGTVTDMRLAVFPTVRGQRAVVRLFYDNQDLNNLETLGLPASILQTLKNIASESQGLLLLTGPAGSGKSTTLAAMIGTILQTTPGRSIVTLEDPVERLIEGVSQIQIPPTGELTFSTALRSLLRQDPEVLMLGEIRDAQTAQIAAQAALTGHLLLSTMHSGNCCAALVRLLEMGIEPYQLTSSLLGIVNQRLLRRLCPECRQRGSDGTYQAVGCSCCAETGYRGRILAAEMVEMDSSLRKAVLARADAEEISRLLQGRGCMNLLQNAQRLIEEGLTTAEEVQRVCGRENPASS
ncbi:MAG TPA: GspE/PulE family protein [Anaerohalosphaeraceae bacterium]|jgi:type II secretory ATPase GspE/PulE/Tfp pilus assembly ATPase PilB-like protein|nr:GspE/PulE family protein [Anaerohalosphaeraceae bacterium]HQG05560.1 GspE/PulE family protein [Anaerohalosphaeraceae bacterium]HQI07384.1 GspE/PulE family protein [Anaerohalosphaeraceae bacterium]